MFVVSLDDEFVCDFSYSVITRTLTLTTTHTEQLWDLSLGNFSTEKLVLMGTNRYNMNQPEPQLTLK